VPSTRGGFYVRLYRIFIGRLLPERRQLTPIFRYNYHPPTTLNAVSRQCVDLRVFGSRERKCARAKEKDCGLLTRKENDWRQFIQQVGAARLAAVDR